MVDLSSVLKIIEVVVLFSCHQSLRSRHLERKQRKWTCLGATRVTMRRVTCSRANLLLPRRLSSQKRKRKRCVHETCFFTPPPPQGVLVPNPYHNVPGIASYTCSLDCNHVIVVFIDFFFICKLVSKTHSTNKKCSRHQASEKD